jgi:hypothetical protein
MLLIVMVCLAHKIPDRLSPVETLDAGVVGGLAGPTEVEFDAALVGPLVHRLGDELAAVVSAE